MAKVPDWRELSGGGDTTPPIAERSRSEGDLNRNSYRNSSYPRLSLRAVCNDDGSPVTTETNGLLREVLTELQAIRAALETTE